MNLLRIFSVLFMATAISGCAEAQQAPRGNLIYCSYSATRVAGLGKSYCELVADTDSVPRVNVILDRDSRCAPERTGTYEVGADVVQRLQEALAKAKVYELDGYYVDEAIDGGTIYRIYMEYDSGDKVNARWYGHDVKPDAYASYNMIFSYFEPWRSQVEAIEIPADYVPEL